MRSVLLAFILLATLLSPFGAGAQDRVTIVPLDADLYEVRYLAFPNTDEVCFFEVNVAGDTADAIVDRNGDSLTDKLDALLCVTPASVDGATENRAGMTLTEPQADQPIAAIGYRVVSAGELQSDFSNVGDLLVRPRAIIILSGGGDPEAARDLG